MEKSQEKVVQMLREAQSNEEMLIRTLQGHIRIAPRGPYRDKLEMHLKETRKHADQLEKRLNRLGATKSTAHTAISTGQNLVAQALALGKAPMDLIRGSSKAEQLLKNARDEAAMETREIVMYESMERYSNAIGDDETARMAERIKSEEERMLEFLRDEIPILTDALAATEVTPSQSQSSS